MGSMFLWKVLVGVAAVVQLLGSTEGEGLEVGFYRNTCPTAEEIVYAEIVRVIGIAPSLAGPLLRMHFHDCFVNGCDGSVLINSTKGNSAEKDAIPNLSLRGFGVIDGIKAKLEKACPETVSCSDILALVARDVVYLTKGPRWEVPTGRRDGRRSVGLDIFGQLPAPFSNITTLKGAFFNKGLTAKDLVVLSGGHTLGTSHCSSFSNRLYNFTGKGDADPIMDKNMLVKLRSKCKPNDLTTLVELDPGSFRTFDTNYFSLVLKRRAVLTSDMALLDDQEIKAYISTVTTEQFFKDFGESMVKMGNILVRTGTNGEIRKHCALVN